jgi:tRNA pseudouridine38-40 synthase
MNEMKSRYALGIQYDGRPWQGWQSQPGGQTVQDALEQALSRFADEPIRVVCAGRTDTGVHALGQVVHFETTAVRELQGWVRGVNALLPDSVAVTWSRQVPGTIPDDFHARFSAMARTYHYVLFVNPVRSPHLVGRAGWCYRPLDAEAMRQAAQTLIGTHDFSAFRSAECQAKTPVKTVHAITLCQRQDFIVVTLRANAFLHHMVRNLVGSLIAIGHGKQDADWLGAVLQGRDRAQAAPTFMADGLYLAAVDYPEHFDIPPAPTLNAVFPGLLD